jgi:hypothetical protein
VTASWRSWLALAVVTVASACRVDFDPNDYDACAELATITDEVYRGPERHCYGLLRGGHPGRTVEAACVAGGAHLATFATIEEHEAVRAGLTLDVSAWFGAGVGTGLWETGEPIGAARWQSGEPAYGRAIHDPDGTWRTADVGNQLAVLCERTVAVTSDRVYVLDYQPASWDVTRVRCGLAGGHLATLTSALEMLDAAPTIAGRRWVGAADEGDTGAYAWITGEAFAPEGLAPLGVVPGDGQRCLAAQSTGWFDADCSAQLPSICELE